VSEPPGGGAAWTEERGASEERRGKAAPQSAPAGERAAEHERGATREGGALKRPGGERGQQSDPDPAGLLDLACSAAQEAARLLASRRPPGPLGRPQVAETKSSPTDVVTEMDRSAEALITRLLLAERPGDAILGEEGGESGHGRVRWIVDPLDGTVNYLYGLPDWAVSIAAEVDGTVVAGVVAIPARGELFTAVLGQGAWSRSAGQPPVAARCNAPVPLHQALVATGFGYTAARRAVQGEVVAAVLPRVRDIRRGGSCAVDLCSVAMGRVDAYYERGVNYWDFAAGGLVATEAGAWLGGLNGKPANPELTIAAEPGLFGALHELLAGLDPERDAPG
jgi:myo-inositol-1(or 4)-monophosphatase